MRGVKRTVTDTKNRIPQKAGDPIPKSHLWYLHEKFDYKKYSELKGKVTGYFRIYEQNRLRHGNRSINRYYKVHENGLMVCVDVEMFKIGIVQGVNVPSGFRSCTKTEFNKAMKTVLKLIL